LKENNFNDILSFYATQKTDVICKGSQIQLQSSGFTAITVSKVRLSECHHGRGSEEQEERTLPEIKRVERVDATRGCEGEGVSRLNKSLRTLQPKNKESKKEKHIQSNEEPNGIRKEKTTRTELNTTLLVFVTLTLCHRLVRRHQRERAREGIAELPVFSCAVSWLIFEVIN
jgi:hypothetical protein